MIGLIGVASAHSLVHHDFIENKFIGYNEDAVETNLSPFLVKASLVILLFFQETMQYNSIFLRTQIVFPF